MSSWTRVASREQQAVSLECVHALFSFLWPGLGKRAGGACAWAVPKSPGGLSSMWPLAYTGPRIAAGGEKTMRL